MSDDPSDHELTELMLRHLEGAASDAETRQLELVLRNSPGARRELAELSVQIVQLRLLAQEAKANVVAFEAPPKKSARLAGRGWALAAAAFLALLAGWAWLPFRSAGPNVAVLVSSESAEWEGAAPAAGQALPAGWLRLRAGTARIDFASGAEVRLTAPAALRVVSAMEGFLERGALHAYVPAAAHGFTIRGVDFSVVDRGTEFGCLVPAVGGVPEVHVLAGQVAVRSGGGPELLLAANEAVRLPPGKAEPIAANATLFPARFAAALDTLVLGNAQSEAAHGLVATASEVTGAEWQLSGAGPIGGEVGMKRMRGGTADAFFFHAQELTGDGFITARVVVCGGDGRQVRTGVMMRESAEPGAPYVFALDNRWDQFGPAVVVRAVKDAAPKMEPFDAVRRPLWLRLERQGDIFTTSASEDGKTWRAVSTQTVKMNRVIRMGLATTAFYGKETNEAIFDHLATSAPAAPWTGADIGPVAVAGKAARLGLGEPARRLLPLDPPDYYGGELTFKMKVDPAAQNYCTVKLWGAEANGNRVALVCEGQEVGSRHGGTLAMFLEGVGAVAPGAFWYRTTPLPRWLTAGKTSVEIKLRATGSFYTYGAIWNYDTYQKKQTRPTRALYRLYTHMNPVLETPGETPGTTPDYTQAPVRATTTEEAGLARVKAQAAERIARTLKNPAPPRGDLEFLATAYAVEWTPAFKKPEVAAHCVRVLDDECRRFHADPKLAAGEWGGGYGAHGLAVARIAADIAPRLDERPDLGAGAKPRREQWAAMLQASRDEGRFHRRTITNQVIIGDRNVYLANLGLLALKAPAAFPEPQARRYLREACGVEDWRGDDLPAGGSAYNLGRGVRMITARGTTHEWNWCCHNCYGRMSPYVLELARLTGDADLEKMAVQMERAHAALLYPSVDGDGFRALLNEGVICTRNVYHPGNPAYSYLNVAATGRDPLLVGGAAQQLADGQMWDVWFDSALSLFIPQDFARLKTLTAKLPRPPLLPPTPGQPDFAWADEQNAVVSIKRGRDHHFLTFYRRWNAVTRIGDAHTITPQSERVVQFALDDVRFEDAGESMTLGPEVQTTFTGTPPDKPVGAWTGQKLPKVRYENGETGALPDFYGVRYGDFVIGMNCAFQRTYLLHPPGFAGGTDLISGKKLAAPVSVPPQTTVVFFSPLKTGPLEPDLARNPVPWNTAPPVPAEGLTLAWQPGADARTHRVYLGLQPALTAADLRGEVPEPAFPTRQLLAGKTYYWRVDEVNAAGVKPGAVWSFTTIPAITHPWQSRDLGDAKDGSFTASGALSMKTAGGDIWSKSDGLRFAWLPVTGDCTIIARVAALESPGSGNGKAGVMIRAALDPAAPQVSMLLTAGKGALFARRSSAGSDTAQTGREVPGVPYWVRLERRGDIFTGYTSADGVRWQKVGRERVQLSAAVFLGLAASNVRAREPLSVRFAQVFVESAAPTAR